MPLVGSGEGESLSQRLRTPSLGRKRRPVLVCAVLTRSPGSLQAFGWKRERSPTPHEMWPLGGGGENLRPCL